VQRDANDALLLSLDAPTTERFDDLLRACII